ncbi:MAG: exo-alpha-sialidase [Alphaproteobacteria bacterium]
MQDRLLIGTRKGLFIMREAGGGWSLERSVFLGQPVSAVLHDTRSGILYAALDLGHFGAKLHRSRDCGESWDEIAPPAFAKSDAKDAPSVKLIWTLEAGGDGQDGRLWAGTIPGGLFQSDDHGESWVLNEALWNVPERARWVGGGYDEPGIHSLVVDVRDPNRLIAGVSCGGVWVSEDDGQSWMLRADGLRSDYTPPGMAEDGAVQDPHLLVQCTGAPDSYWIQHHNGIFKSTDDLASWQEIHEFGPSTFGFAVAVHPKDPDTAWFVPAIKDEYRYPVDGKFVVTRTRDGGKTAEVLTNGLPQANAYDLVYRHALAIDEGGDRLAMGSTSGGLWVTGNGGDSWQLLPERLPPVYTVRFAWVP